MWCNTAIGDPDANGNFSCPTRVPLGTQVFWPVLTEQQYGGWDPFNPADKPFQQQRARCLRVVSHIDISMCTIEDETEESVYVRWALCRFDTDEVASAPFDSLFTPDFFLSERVLLTGQTGQKNVVSGRSPQVFGSSALYEPIIFESRLTTNIETGMGIYLVIEPSFCTVCGTGLADRLISMNGWVRTYFVT